MAFFEVNNLTIFSIEKIYDTTDKIWVTFFPRNLIKNLYKHNSRLIFDIIILSSAKRHLEFSHSIPRVLSQVSFHSRIDMFLFENQKLYFS